MDLYCQVRNGVFFKTQQNGHNLENAHFDVCNVVLAYVASYYWGISVPSGKEIVLYHLRFLNIVKRHHITKSLILFSI